MRGIVIEQRSERALANILQSRFHFRTQILTQPTLKRKSEALLLAMNNFVRQRPLQRTDQQRFRTLLSSFQAPGMAISLSAST